MRFLAVSAAALIASTAVAHAETFTLTGTEQVTSQIGARDATGRMVHRTFTTVEKEITLASGAKRTLTGRCESTPATSRDKKAVTVETCALSDATGAFTAVITCKPLNAARTQVQCDGDLTGSTGAYQAKTGTISWTDAVAADRKSSASTGSGAWN